MDARLQRADKSWRAAEAEVAALRQRLAVAEEAVLAREREMERAVKGAQADGAGLGAKVGGRNKDAVAPICWLGEVLMGIALLDKSRTNGHCVHLALQLAALEETVRGLQAELASARDRAMHLDTCLRDTERELAALASCCEAAKAEAAEAAARRREAEEEARKAEGEAAAAKGRATQLEGLVKVGVLKGWIAGLRRGMWRVTVVWVKARPPCATNLSPHVPCFSWPRLATRRWSGCSSSWTRAATPRVPAPPFATGKRRRPRRRPRGRRQRWALHMLG